jgi:adenylate cyclase
VPITHNLLTKKLRSKWTQVYIGLFCTIIVFLADVVDVSLINYLIDQLDNRIYDQIVQLNWHPHYHNPQVVIIDIDNNSVQKEGRWPWPRNKMAQLVNKLKQSGVVTIGLDIVMAEPEVNYAVGLKEELKSLKYQFSPNQKQLPALLDEIASKVDNDQIFAQSLLDHNIVLGFLFHNDQVVKKGVLPPSLTYPNGQTLYRGDLDLYQFSGYNGCLELFLNAAKQAGSVTNLPDFDGSVRHGLAISSYNNHLYPSLALATAMNYLMVDHVQLQIYDNKLWGIQLGSIFVPTNEYGQILIPFWGPPGTLNYYSATDIMQGNFNPKDLQGAIAIVGSTIILLADLHQSPFSLSFPGVEMVGNMVQGMVSQQLIAPYNWDTWHGRIYLLLVGLLFTIIFSFVGVTGMLILAPLSILFILGASVYLFTSKSLYVPLAYVLILITLQTLVNYGYLFMIERKQKRKINQLFGQYVPQEYVKALIEIPDQSSMEGQERNMTVQFGDIRDFTSISEGLEASEVKRLLNNFFTPITEIIFSFHGTIDKYVGDMIVAFWGAPINDEEHAYHAVLASLKIIDRLTEINTKLGENNLPQVRIGLGLASGLMNVGDMGSEFRRAYTVIGDTVNLASRLQDLTKFYHADILVSDSTRAGLDHFVWRTVDKITVKGRKTGLIIYQPLGPQTEITPEVLAELDEYHGALEDYYARNWSSAEKKFDMLKTKSPEMYLYKLYLERIKEFLVNPPGEYWTGIYVHLQK